MSGQEKRNLRFTVPGLTISSLSVPISYRIIDVRRELAVRDSIRSLFVLRQFGRILPDYGSLTSSWVTPSRPFEILFVRPPPCELLLFKAYDFRSDKTFCLSVYNDETINDVKQLLHHKFDFPLEGLLISENGQTFFDGELSVWNLDLTKRYLVTHSQLPQPVSDSEGVIWRKEFYSLTLTELHFVKNPNPVRTVPDPTRGPVIRLLCSPRIMRRIADEKRADAQNVPLVAGGQDSRPDSGAEESAAHQVQHVASRPPAAPRKRRTRGRAVAWDDMPWNGSA
jgi:hypothetical protein